MKSPRRPKGALASAPKPERVTLYVKPEHRELLEWARAYTQARSLSEAVFSALADLKVRVKAGQIRALEETQGMWRDDPRIAEAFAELEKGWKAWHSSLEGKGS